ncbi:hypothetical protein [Ohtaekwangia sp.]|uniref:hypothetical protein n=1 Tax=Ohtaekwangia sp. TaxID=2066019 RepID=UPI002FDD4182
MKKYTPLLIAGIAETLFSFRILSKAIHEGSLWKIVFSLIGFALMLAMTFFFFIRIKTKAKESGKLKANKA